MALKVLQRGTGTSLVVCAGPMPHAGQPWELPAAALAALGPVPCVVGCAAPRPETERPDPTAMDTETMEQIHEFAETRVGRKLWLAACVGFSAGCRRVRALWWAGATAFAFVLADGLQAAKPPEPPQLDYARDIVAAARAGQLLVIIEHTYIEVGPRITSTSEMARTVTGWPLAPPPLGQTLRRVDPPPPGSPSWSGLVVYSTGSGPADREAHRDQALRVLPLALGGRVRQLVELAARPEVAPRGATVAPQSTPEPPAEVVLDAGAPMPSAAPPSAPKVTPRGGRGPGTTAATIHFIGDSLAQGVAPALAALARDTPVNFAMSGRQSTNVRDWDNGLLPAILGSPPPALVLISLGTNSLRGNDPAGQGAEAGALIDRIRAAGVRDVAWIGPPDLAGDTGAFRPALEKACAERGVRIFDSQALPLPKDASGIHLTREGYATWAKAIAAWVPFSAYANGADEGGTLGERAVRFSLKEQLDGVCEEPPGSNRSPRIDQYRRGMGAAGDPWCAWGFCYAANAVLRPGERLPHAYTGSVAEIMRTGRFHKSGDGYAPRVGDGAVWERDNEDPTRSGKGHIGRVLVTPDATGSFRTIEANSGDAWTEREHQLDEPHLLGWIEYPQAAALQAAQTPGARPLPATPATEPLQGQLAPSAPPFRPGEGRRPINPSDPLGLRAGWFSIDEQRAGVRDGSPRIAEYRRGQGRPSNPWDASAFCFAAQSVLQPNERLPHAYSILVSSLVRTGRFHRLGDGYAPRTGDGAIWAYRGDPTTGGPGARGGRVERVFVAPGSITEDAGLFETVAGDSHGGWEQRRHRIDEDGLLGWLEYPVTRLSPVPETIVVEDMGAMPFEEYVGRVVTGEIGSAREPQALMALAMAARSYAVWMMTREGWGTAAKPITNSQRKQVVAGNVAPLCAKAAQATRGGLVLHNGRVVLCYHVAGAIWLPGATSGLHGEDPYRTEHAITYNLGRAGGDVHPTPIGLLTHPDNRGCLSQNGAVTLAQQGALWPQILRFFYGRDITFTIPSPAPAPPRPPPPASGRAAPSSAAPKDDGGGLLLAGAALAALVRALG